MLPRLVGRDHELGLLAGVVADVAAGAGRFVLLSGEAGIGKSRLAAEVVKIAERQGFRVLRGSAHALHTGLAYAPVVEALRPCVDADPAEHVDLAPLIPGLGSTTPEPVTSPELEKLRLFEAVARTVGAMSRRGPLLLFLDDLQWADRATVSLVHYVARAMVGSRVLILVTYRTAEPGVLGELAASLRRAGTAVEITLPPLAAPVVTELLGDVLGAAPPAELLGAITARAAGVPLFVTALARQLIESGRLARTSEGWALVAGSLELPAIVRDVVLSRLAHLDAAERRMFELVAVAGERATPDLLQAVWDRTAVPFDEPLRRLVTDRLVTERPGRTLRYEVTHPLYAEVAYAELGERERRLTHAALAGALDRLSPDDVVALAPHYRGAASLVDPARTLEVLAAAGRRALDLHADREAVRYLGLALEHARALSRGELLAELLDRLGQAYERCGDGNRAVQAWQEGIAVARERGTGQALGMMLHRLALLEWERGRMADADEYLRAGLATGTVCPDDLVEQYYLRLMLLSRLDDEHRQRAAATQLVQLAGRSRTPRCRAAEHLARAHLAAFDQDHAQVVAEAQRALALAEDAGRVFVRGGAYREITLAAVTIGKFGASRDFAARYVEETRRLGIPTLECSARATQAVICYLAGEWDAALAELDAAITLGRRAAGGRGAACGLALRGLVLARRGQLGPAQECVAEAAALCGNGLAADRSIAAILAVGRAAVTQLRGDRRHAAMPRGDLHACTASPHALNLVVVGEARAATGDLDGALAVAGRLRSFGGAAVFPTALADRLEGTVAAIRGQTDQAARLLVGAATTLDALGMPFEAAVARLGWCEVEPSRAAEPAMACAATFDRLGARPWRDRCDRLLRSLGIRTVARPAASGVLSAREAEVARLLAEGLSNAEIAAHLFISVRTVETHLHRIYSRLGLGSRVALVRWAARHAVVT